MGASSSDPSQQDACLGESGSAAAEISPAQARQQMAADRPWVALDVREPSETRLGHIEDAVCIPRGALEARAVVDLPDPRQPLLVYCARGTRSVLACETLRRLGYASVTSLSGGFEAWKAAGLPFTQAPESGDLERYERHLRIPEIGEAGQRTLLARRVLLVGAGGLGSAAALYLAAAGVGHLTIVDSDAVELSNLQRQVLHTTPRIGRAKVDSAQETLHALNPQVRVETHAVRLTQDNADMLIGRHDVVVDGCDSFATRYLVNDVCRRQGVANVYASIHRFDGQASVFLPGRGPCYRCLYPAPPSAGHAPSCDEAGVLGVLPGLMGVIQATEAIKLLLGLGRSLHGRLLCCDALEMTFREFRLDADPRCPACGPDADPDRCIDDLETDAPCARRSTEARKG